MHFQFVRSAIYYIRILIRSSEPLIIADGSYAWHAKVRGTDTSENHSLCYGYARPLAIRNEKSALADAAKITDQLFTF